MTGTLEHEALGDEAIHAIVKQLRHYPAMQQIIKSIVMVEEFKSAFKCVPEKTASYNSEKGYQHYKVCAECSSDGLADTKADIHAALVSISLLTGYCPERWKQIIDVMLEKIPGANGIHLT
jgi:hypothetical protein